MQSTCFVDVCYPQVNKTKLINRENACNMKKVLIGLILLFLCAGLCLAADPVTARADRAG
jgi:hypothetical protein